LITFIIVLTVVTIAAAALWLAPQIRYTSVVYDTAADAPCPFGYRMAWLAIRTRETARVIEVLGLTDATPSNWQTGIGAVYDRELGERRLFVSPPVNGWTFVVGLSLPHPVGRGFINKCGPLLEELGQTFSEVQYFFTFPAIDFHAWARVIDGRLVRGFGIGDEGVVWNVGKPTKEERALGLKLFELRGVRGRKGDAGGELILHPTEDHVMRLAHRWSVDPTTLDRTRADPALGVVAMSPSHWHAERLRKSA
jgi:hypothetical protein